jgi:hypothetical protein
MVFDLAGAVDDPAEPVDSAGLLDVDLDLNLPGLDLASLVDPSTSGRLLFRGLLLSCRAIYREASALLFSSNKFVIHYRHGAERSLQPLRNLTASSLAALASLKIVLNQSSCHHRKPHGDGLGTWTCCRGTAAVDAPHYSTCHSQHTARHDSPLQNGDAAAGPMLDEWLRTAEFLSSRIRPGALQLSLVCDLDEQAEADIATKVVAPLFLFPELKGCHVRLCRSPNPQLGQIARRAALQACHKPEPASPPSFSGDRLLSLPRELRLRILEYTDLVTPWRQVVWARLELARGYLRPEAGCCIWDDIPCPPALHHGCQFSGCYIPEYRKDGVAVYSDAAGCFCRIRHAAFSSSCRCWAPPTPLFLICRTLLEDARFVFFSLNRFVVNDTLASSVPYIAFDVLKTIKVPAYHYDVWDLAEDVHAQPPSSYPAERFAASQFLRQIVPVNCLGYLRFLEIVFPPHNYACWPHDGHPALQDWVATIDWARNKINTPGLTLRLTMAGSLAWPPARPDERKLVTQAQGDQVLAGYDRILKPLACLGEDGLARFYADFAWPWKWVYPLYDGHRELTHYQDLLAWTRSKEDVLNERAGRFILGDRYDRLRLGEGTLEIMPWTIHCMPSY